MEGSVSGSSVRINARELRNNLLGGYATEGAISHALGITSRGEFRVFRLAEERLWSPFARCCWS